MGSDNISIELRQVSKKFESSFAVENLNLSIPKGEFFSFLGPSGCGKTTTLRMIGGFEYPTSGQILLEGKSIENTPPYKRNINTVFQSYALFPHMNIFDNVAFGLRMKKTEEGDVKKRVLAALEGVKLGGFELRKPSQLSGGQRQRVALARAIVNQPAVLLLDEPLAALDLKLRRAMQLELKELQHKLGITFVFVTHDQEEALTMSDRIAVMNKGKFEQIGTPSEIYDKPETKFVADFIGSMNFIDTTVVSIHSDCLELVTNWGRPIFASLDSSYSIGQNVIASIRPEKFILSIEKPTGFRSNGLEGRLHEIIYLGMGTQYIVNLTNGEKIAIFAQNGARSLPSVQPGQTVYATFAWEHCRTIKGT